MSECYRKNDKRLRQNKESPCADHGNEKKKGNHEPKSFVKLPLSILGGVLNFLTCEDVMSATSTCRIMRFESSRHVTDLAITRSQYLHVTLANRFPNVERVKILSLFEVSGNHYQRTTEVFVVEKISAETAVKTVPFLSRLPKLQRVTFGPEAQVYRCREPFDHRLLYRDLINAFVGAYKSGALSRDLKVDGSLFGLHDIAATDDILRQQGHNMDNVSCCRFCEDVAKTFPFETVFQLVRGDLEMDSYSLGNLCLEEEDRCQILLNRPGGRNWFQSGRPLLLYLQRSRACTDAADEDDGAALEPEQVDFLRRMRQRGAVNPGLVNYIASDDLSRLAILKDQYGCNPRLLDPKDVAYAIGRGEVLPRTVFNRVAALGIPIEEEDFCVFDDEEDPITRDWKEDGIYWWDNF